LPPLALLAGLTGIAAGSIAMGLGGFLAVRSDPEHYASELECEQIEVIIRPDAASLGQPSGRPASPKSNLSFIYR
jgi:hypothetical protein